LSKSDDLVDELMSASAAPTQTRTAAPLPPARKGDQSSGFHFWVIGVAVAAAAAIGGILYGLLWALDAVKL
jgi:hypothetical protein